MIITLSGVDCAGKTTQLDALEAALTERGHRVKRLWFRPGYSPLLDTLRTGVRKLRPSALPSNKNPEARKQAFAKPGVSRTWVEETSGTSCTSQPQTGTRTQVTTRRVCESARGNGCLRVLSR